MSRPTAGVPELDARGLAAELAALIGEQTICPLLDADQVAALLNVPASWVRAEARAGRIPNVQLGHYRRFDREELLAWVDRRKQGPRAQLRRGDPA